MVNMENAEEVMQILDRFTRLKQKEIPKELDEYLQYVAKTGDTVFKWSSLKYLFREKLLNVIKHFHDTSPRVDEIPQYPNVDPFNYESMKSSLLERLELFNAAPFTIQRLCELLIDPRKQYSRIDKFMRALEKNILVVSTIEPGRKRTESENGDSLDSVVNGDLSLDVNVDIDMENESLFNMEAQNGNGNGTVAAADVVAAADADATAEAETETVDVKGKEKAAAVAEVANAKHATTDDDILPNPKKAKLDLVEREEKETEKEKDKELDGGVDIADLQPAAKAETEPEVSSVASKDVVDQETEAAKKDLDDADMLDDDKPVVLKEVQEKNETLKEQEELEAKKKENEKEKGSVEAQPQKDNKKIDEEKEKEKKASSDGKKVSSAKQADDEAKRAKTEVDAGSENGAVPAIFDKAELEEHGKVIEKQEIEKGEKEDKQEPPVAAELAKTEVKSVKTAQKKVEEQKDTVKDVVGDHVDNKPIAEEAVKPSEITEIGKDVNAEKETIVPKDTTVVVAASATKNEAESIGAVSEAKSEAEKIAPESDTANTASAKAQVEKTENGSDDEVAASAADVKVTVDVTTATTPNAEASSANATPAIDKLDDADAANAPRDEPPPVAELITEVQPAITADENNTAAVSETAAVSVAAAPALALNDQPMDDGPLDEALPAIDEVVMAESGGATAMATDAIEPAKDEPAGMEVDDTSQEAMDQ